MILTRLNNVINGAVSSQVHILQFLWSDARSEFEVMPRKQQSGTVKIDLNTEQQMELAFLFVLEWRNLLHVSDLRFDRERAKQPAGATLLG